MIVCKRVYLPAGSGDGYRVLIDRLWPRGVAKADLVLDEWCKTLAPSNELRKAWHQALIDFDHFAVAYRLELDAHRDEALRLATLANEGTVTLLYGAKNSQQNHALVLQAYLQQLTPSQN